MIDYILPGAVFSADLDGAHPNLVGELSVAILYRPSGVELVPPSVADIAEMPPGSGLYTASNLIAPLDAGDYWVVWEYDDPDNPGEIISSREELRVTTSPNPAVVGGILPETSEVADISPRATTMGGGELDDFTAVTKPTKSRVERLIQKAYDDIVAKLGSLEGRENLQADARNAVIYYTAMLIELKYFPEQVSSDRSPYDKFKELLETTMNSLLEAIGAEGETGADENAPDGSGPLKPRFAFDGFAIGYKSW